MCGVLDRRDRAARRVVEADARTPGPRRRQLVEHLDGHVPPDVRLDRPEDDPVGSLADLFQQPIAAQRFAVEIQLGVVS